MVDFLDVLDVGAVPRDEDCSRIRLYYQFVCTTAIEAIERVGYPQRMIGRGRSIKSRVGYRSRGVGSSRELRRRCCFNATRGGGGGRVNIDPVGVWPASKRFWRLTMGACRLALAFGDSTKFCSTCQTGRPTFNSAPGPTATPVFAAILVTNARVAGSDALVVPYSAMN